MHYSLSNSLGRPYVSGLDPDAKAYISAITTEGATLTGAQKSAISDFVIAEKAASRWTGLKRLYLPVWGVAAANAICMKSLTSGTFVGGVTHGAGYVQSDGSTGYFDSGTKPSDVGQTMAGASCFRLILEEILGNNYNGAVDPSGSFFFGTNSANLICVVGTIAGVSSASDERGISVYSRTSTTGLDIYKRDSAGFTTVGSDPTLDTGVLPAVNMFFAGARNGNGTPGIWATTSKDGLYGMALGLDSSASAAFTLNLKTLWETVTGLTLP